MRTFWWRMFFWIFFSLFFAYKAAYGHETVFFILFAFGLIMFIMRSDYSLKKWRARHQKKIENIINKKTQ